MNYTNIKSEEFDKLKSRENHIILDVRSPQELAEGSVPRHVMINFFDPDFSDKIAQLDKTKTYLVYCRSGNRSGQACTLMSNMGFGKVYNLEGGISAWNDYTGR